MMGAMFFAVFLTQVFFIRILNWVSNPTKKSGLCLDLAMEKNVSLRIKDAEIHFVRMEIDSTILLCAG